MSFYITVVMLIMFTFNATFWGIEVDNTKGFFEGTGENRHPTGKNTAFTMLFNTFIHLHLFNQINCRKIKNDQYNVFQHFFSLGNIYALLVFIIQLVVQYIFVQYGGYITRCAEISGDQYAFSVLIGSTSLIIGLVLKKLPEAWTKKLPMFIDEKKEV